MTFTLMGCQPTSPMEAAGLTLVVPDSWQPLEADAWVVPGTPLGAWAGPESSSLTVYRSLPSPGVTASMLTESLANRLTNLSELKVLVRRTETVAGLPAARVEV